MSLRSKVVIESNLKPSQFGKPSIQENNEDFEEIYENPLEKSKPSPPRVSHGEADLVKFQELPRNEPEIMEFSNPSKNFRYSNDRDASEKISSLDEPSAAPVARSGNVDRSSNDATGSYASVNEGFEDFEEQIIPKKNMEKLVAVQSQDPSRTIASLNDKKQDLLPDDKPDISFQGVVNVIKSLDANRYATKKTIAQGMLDIALLTANASQLKYILQIGKQHEFYILMLSLICVSIGLQALVGILYVIVGGLNINKNKNHRAASILNDLILISVFFISLINVVISGFGIEHSNAPYLREYNAAYRKLEYHEKVIQGVICVLLGSSLNINKQQDQRKANVWNNICLILMVLTVAINAVISAFDMRDNSALTQANTTRGVTSTQLRASGGR